MPSEAIKASVGGRKVNPFREINTLNRFLSRTKMSGGCWEWIGAKTGNGYGMMHVASKTTTAHRYAYATFVEPIPDGLAIDHLCRNRACVNPDHLEPVTLAENNRRVAALKTHCSRGHGVLLVNTPAGRKCPICEREAQRKAGRKYSAKRRARIKAARFDLREP
jgi:hypothetical protein